MRYRSRYKVLSGASRFLGIAGTLLYFLVPMVSKAQDSVSKNQKDVRDFIHSKKHIKTTEDRKSKIVFSFLPSAGGSAGNKALVTSFVTTFNLGDNDSTKLSYIYFTPWFTFSGQFVFPVRTYVYTKNNKYNFTGEYKYQIYPQDVFQLGKLDSASPQSIISYEHFRFHQVTSRSVYKNFFVGAGINLDYYYHLEEEKKSVSPSDFQTYMKGSYEPFVSNGLAVQFLYDTRQNTLNSKYGTLCRANFRFNTKWMGSTNKWGSFYLDVRKYISLSKTKNRVLALWGLYWTTTYGVSHYLDLPSVGSDIYGRTGRGTQRNSLKSNALLYLEGEYRFDITRNGLLGAVFFMNATAPSTFDTQKFSQWYPAIGSGLRLRWDKNTRTNLTLDAAVSTTYWAWYVGIAEFF